MILKPIKPVENFLQKVEIYDILEREFVKLLNYIERNYYAKTHLSTTQTPTQNRAWFYEAQ